METISLTLACAIRFCGSVNLLMSVAYGSSGLLMRSQSMDFNPVISRTASTEVQDRPGSINHQGSKAKQISLNVSIFNQNLARLCSHNVVMAGMKVTAVILCLYISLCSVIQKLPLSFHSNSRCA